MTKVFPSILPGRDFVDERYGRRELERMEWNDLRRIASKIESDEVNGHMPRDEMVAALEGLKRV